MSRNDIRHAVAEMVSVASGGESYYIEKARYLDVNTKDELKDLLYEIGVPQAKVVKEDMGRVLVGEQPFYFAYGHRLTEEFRGVRGIPSPSENPRLQSESTDMGEVIDEVLEDLKDPESRAPLQKSGFACPAEQEAFYGSEEWRQRAKAVRAMDGFQCRSCGQGNRELHVHHIQPIYSFFGRKGHRNFDVARMRTLCSSCHYDLHDGAVRDENGFHQAKSAEEQDQAAKFRDFAQQQHDDLKECQWCQQFEWTTA